jgi:hypothetical protein
MPERMGKMAIEINDNGTYEISAGEVARVRGASSPWNELDAYCSDDECDCQRHTANYGGDKWLQSIVMNLAMIDL